MTGLHALHMIIGAGLLNMAHQGILRAALRRNTTRPSKISACIGISLISCDFLFPLLYLIDRH